MKFAIVGASGVGVNTAVLWMLHGQLGMVLFLASAIAIEASILNNFAWNDRWTFKWPTYILNDKVVRYGLKERLAMFHIVSAGGGLINWACLLVLSFFGVWYLAANLGGILVAFAWNYKMNLSYTWSKTT